MQRIPPEPDAPAARIVAAREALTDGDYELALSILLDLERELAPIVTRVVCELCGDGFEWPGLLDAHQVSGLCRGGAEEIAA
jgi:hypothetical protein